MINKNLVLLFVLVLLIPVESFSDYFVDYYEIKHNRDLGFIIINDGLLRGKSIHKNAAKKRKELQSTGIFLADSKKMESFKREFSLEKHKVKVVLKVFPPRGRGYGGANYNADVTVFINGKERFSIPLGYRADLKELWVRKIVIHHDGIISFNANHGIKGQYLDLSRYSFFTSPKDPSLTYEKLLEELRKQDPENKKK